MPERKRVLLWLAGGTGVFLVLLAAVFILLPRLIDSDRVRANLAEEASTAVGGAVQIRGLELSYWPSPHLTIREAKLDVPGAVTGSIRTLTVYPGIFPLLRGKVQVSDLRLEAPEFTVTIPDRGKTAFAEVLRSFLDSMARNAPDLRIALTDGRVDLSGGGLPPLSFREIAASAVLPPDGPDVDLSCTGTLWNRGQVKGRLDAESLAGAARIVLKGFRPHLLGGYLFPGATTGISDSDIDLDLRVETDGLAKLRADWDLSLSRMALFRGKRTLEVAGGKLQGTLNKDAEKISVALKQLSLAFPQISISGNIFLDGETRKSRADAQAWEVDIAILREQALALAGDVPLVKEIFSVLRAGTIPALSYRAEGISATDLWELENMEFEGSVLNGFVTVDAGGVDLAIGKIRGDLALRRGILEASNLEGIMGNNNARRGTLRMGFLGPDPPFHLETDVSADVSGLPYLLHQLIPSESFRKELSRVEELSGSARGRLILGEKLKSIDVAVKVDAMNLSGKVQGLPYPLTVSGGQFLYREREEEIAVEGAKGRFGQTTFSELAGNIRMTDPALLDMRSGTIRLFLDELFPWARSADSLRDRLANLENVSGTVALSINRLEGALLAPGGWNFDLSGNVERLSLSIPSIPGTIKIPRGSFQANPDTFRFENLAANLLDSSVSVSGSLKYYRTDAPSGVVTGDGRSGPEMIGFLYEQGKIPPGFAVRPPLEASGFRMEWQKDSLVALGGEFVVGDGVKVTVDIFHPPGEWVVRNLSLLDRDFRASLSLHWKPESLDIAFDGFLTHESVNRIFVSGGPSLGWLKGNFLTSLRLDDPVRSTAMGTLEGKELNFLRRTNIPVLVDNLTLSAEGRRVAIENAGIAIGNSSFRLEGEAAVAPDGFTIDMDASADGLDWENLQEAFGILEAKDGSPSAENGAGKRDWDVPVQGTVRLRAGYFRYGGHTIEPANAEIAFGSSGVTLKITEASHCGIPLTGSLRASPGSLEFQIRPDAKEQDIESFFECFAEYRGRVTGRFDLAGSVEGRLQEGEDPVHSLRGSLDLAAREGRIYGTPVLSRVLSLLNPTNIFQGKLPNIRREGIDYRTLSIRAEKGEGSVASLEYILMGDTIEMVGQGGVDLTTGECDIQILVSPTRTVNAVIRKIPVLGYLLGGTLVQVPVKVSGMIQEPDVSLLEPAAVARNLLGIAERTFLLPVELIRPALPGERNGDQ